jgi:hypothetical protein
MRRAAVLACELASRQDVRRFLLPKKALAIPVVRADLARNANRGHTGCGGLPQSRGLEAKRTGQSGYPSSQTARETVSVLAARRSCGAFRVERMS